MVVVVMEKLLGMCYLPLEGMADDLARKRRRDLGAGSGGGKGTG